MEVYPSQNRKRTHGFECKLWHSTALIYAATLAVRSWLLTRNQKNKIKSYVVRYENANFRFYWFWPPSVLPLEEDGNYHSSREGKKGLRICWP